MEELQVLAEVPEEIHQPKIHQKVGNLLALGFLGLLCVDIQVSHNDGVMVPKLEQGLLQV